MRWGGGVPEIPLSGFHHRIAEMETSYCVYGSDPSWGLSGGNSSSGAEVRAVSTSYSAGGISDSKDMPYSQSRGPGDLLWDLMEHKSEGLRGWW